MNNYTQAKMPISRWSEEDQPREKLMARGRQHLTDAELVAILLGSGNTEESAVGLAKRILFTYDHDLDRLGKVGVKELIKQFKGVGEAKAVTIVAALELGRRRQIATPTERPIITNSAHCFQQLAPVLQDLAHEEFWMLLLNQAGRLISRKQVSRGGVTSTVVDARLIFKAALEEGAVSIILGHNHPSGNLRPSNADLKLTQKLKKAGEHLDIRVLDHLIIGERSYYSFADEGVL